MVKNSKKPSLGYIYFRNYYDKDDDLLIRLLERKLNVIHLTPEEEINLGIIKSKTKDCGVILNNYVIGPVTFEAIELSKTLEELGKKVINSSHSFYYQEDKWMFYLKCLEHNLPTPKTYFIPKETRYDSTIIKQILENKELVLKAAFSERGLCVEKVSDYPMFLKKLSRIINKTPTSPIIAQEYIPNKNRSYRATLINHKVKQFIVKIGHSWKQKGDEDVECFRKAKISKRLKDLCERASRAFGMEVCGLDLVVNNGRWYIIEANGCPYLRFIKKDHHELAESLANFLYSVCKKSG